MAGIFWLASYPKSGNTWTRSFLANLLNEQDVEMDINSLHTGNIASSPEWVEDALGIDIGELDHEEIDRLRPQAYLWIAEHEVSNYHKIHDAYTYLPDGEPLIPAEATRGALCLIRNPLDVAVSYANHSNISIDKAVESICNRKHAFCKTVKGKRNQLRQILLTWSGHIESWLDADITRLVMRYEDMLEQPISSFTSIAQFLDIEASQQEIELALKKSHFDRLREQEEEMGFREKAPKVKHFFRKGIVGDWQSVLTDEQIEKIVSVNRSGMQRMGYLDDQGMPVTHRPDYPAKNGHY